jgi:hypothetical protein
MAPRAQAAVARGLSAAAARRVMDRVAEAVAALDEGGWEGGAVTATPPVTALAATASGRRAQARGLAAAAAAAGAADPRGAALARIAELAAGKEAAGMLDAARGLGLGGGRSD